MSFLNLFLPKRREVVHITAMGEDEFPVIEMVSYDSPRAKEHLRVTGETDTLCGSDTRTWRIVGVDGRLQPGKECYECVSAYWKGSALVTADHPELPTPTRNPNSIIYTPPTFQTEELLA